jgi:hypothetical protein
VYDSGIDPEKELLFLSPQLFELEAPHSAPEGATIA